MSTWSGKTLGNVLIGDLIARGGMAEVYYGVHSNLKRRVAVKIMRDHVEEDPDSRTRFAREARVVATLDHPNIIQIFDYDLVDGIEFSIKGVKRSQSGGSSWNLKSFGMPFMPKVAG